MRFLILCHVVITLFTFCTFQCDSCAHNFHLAFFKLNSVLHGSLRDYPNLGIKKRPTSIRQYSLPCTLRICQVFLLDFPQDILKWSKKNKNCDKIADSMQNVKRNPADPPCNSGSNSSCHCIRNCTQHAERQSEKSTQNRPQKQAVVLSEYPHKKI